ncbi:MAG: hypothetical protein JNM42_12475 [Propionivibrio sp.]|uniref:hypothetical protein n=1 Tax=Propionivibrio sp. TaxID=2212460 RepID=UPI001A4FE364|nr:hypothetical protein [Propionivibrio sp.]MBL8415244.1 hypothetical protein [Propionivibrio sp.]
MNIVLEKFPVLDAAHFICAEPRWMGTVLRGLYLLAGLGMAYLATFVPAIPIAASLLLWIVSGLAILAAMRPARATIYYASDALGIYFPERKWSGISGFAGPQTWLLVPWSNISSISVQVLLDESGNTKGVTFCLRASDEDQRLYFARTAMLKHEHLPPVGDRASILVGFPSAFKSPYDIAALLRSFQSRSSEKTTSPDDDFVLLSRQ